jgi:hypothetical protein
MPVLPRRKASIGLKGRNLWQIDSGRYGASPESALEMAHMSRPGGPGKPVRRVLMRPGFWGQSFGCLKKKGSAVHKILLSFLLVFLSMMPARSQLIPGETDTGFSKAVELWLQDDEQTAVPMLASLAGNGNAAAKILLTLIDKTPEYWGPWVASLPRDERIALFRIPGGLSGKNWMSTIADVPLAKAWLQAWQVDMTVATAMEFVDLSEARAARVALIYLDARQGSGFGLLADDPRYPPALRFLIWQEWQRKGIEQGRIAREIAALAPGDPQRAMMGEPVNEAALRNWLMSSPPARPLAAFCQTHCPGTAAGCASAGLQGLGDYRVLNMLDRDEVWIDTPRGQATLLRRIRLASDLSNSLRAPLVYARLDQTDACFSKALQQEVSRF